MPKGCCKGRLSLQCSISTAPSAQHTATKISAHPSLHLTTTTASICQTETRGGWRYLGEHGLAMLGDHGALVAVQRDKVVVEGLLGVLEHVVELCGPSFKDAAEVTGYQSPANCWSGKRKKITSVKTTHPGVHVNKVPMAVSNWAPIPRSCLPMQPHRKAMPLGRSTRAQALGTPGASPSPTTLLPLTVSLWSILQAESDC